MKEGRVGKIGRVALAYTHYHVLQTDNQQEAAIEHRKLSSVLCDDLEGGMGGRGETQERKHMCTHG